MYLELAVVSREQFRRFQGKPETREDLLLGGGAARGALKGTLRSNFLKGEWFKVFVCSRDRPALQFHGISACIWPAPSPPRWIQMSGKQNYKNNIKISSNYTQNIFCFDVFCDFEFQNFVLGA